MSGSTEAVSPQREGVLTPGSLLSTGARTRSYLDLSQFTFPLPETPFLLVVHACNPSTQDIESGELLLV